VNDVGPAILGARGRNAPGTRLGVNLRPLDLGYLLAALTSQREELNDPAKWPRHLTRSKNNGGELLIGQHTIAADFSILRWHTFGRREIDNGATDAPPKEGL
jgi:hypothetical protein